MANANWNEESLQWEESVTAVTATPSVELGSRRYEAGSDWLYVYNGSTQFLDPYRGCRFLSGTSGYTVDVVSPAVSTLTCGLLVGVPVNGTITTGAYGWVMTRGIGSVFNKTSIAIGGSPMYMGASGTFRNLGAASTDTASGALTRLFPAGFWIDDGTSTTATDTVKAYIKSPLF